MPSPLTVRHTASVDKRMRMRGPSLVTGRLFFGLGSECAQVVHDVPHVGLLQAALVALHRERRSGTVPNHGEDLAVGGSAIPLLVGQVRGMRILRRHLAI